MSDDPGVMLKACRAHALLKEAKSAIFAGEGNSENSLLRIADAQGLVSEVIDHLKGEENDDAKG